MEDRDIVDLFWKRDESAIAETSAKYGSFCKRIAQNILASEEDAEECLSDACLSAWNAIPPARPDRLGAFLGRIVRNLALDRYRSAHAGKRFGGEADALLDELAETVGGGEDVESAFDRAELVRSMDEFLGALPREKRVMFVRRYWYAEPIAAIASDCGGTVGGVTMSLRRTREKLRKFLHERGFEV